MIEGIAAIGLYPGIGEGLTGVLSSTEQPEFGSSLPLALVELVRDELDIEGVEAVFMKYLADSRVLLLYVVIPDHDDALEDLLFDKEEELQRYIDKMGRNGDVLVDLRFRLAQGRHPSSVVPIPDNPVFVR